MITRRKTRQISVGSVRIGGGAPVSIQSMTKTDTIDVAKTVKQVKGLEKLGCEIIRVAVKNSEAARAIKKIKEKINIPLVADIHFHYNLAIEAINSGADKIRLNPGNIRDKADITRVIKLAKKRKIPIRIGVNSGSLPSVIARREAPKQSQKREIASLAYGSLAMTEAALAYIKIFESMDFRDIIVSLKASDVATTIDAYRQMAGSCDYPLHLGVTAAGACESGIIKSSVGIGALLAEGIGDTIRVSLTGKPEDEVKVAQGILSSLGLRRLGFDIISCPTCGRCEVDLVKVVRDLEKRLPAPRDDCHLKVAIMGCIVNGPGEAKDADIGIAAGKKSGILFKHGKIVRKIKEADFIKVLLKEIASLRSQ